MMINEQPLPAGLPFTDFTTPLSCHTVSFPTENNLCKYRIANMEFQQQYFHANLQDGADYDRQVSSFQTSAVGQTSNLQQTVCDKEKNYIIKALLTNVFTGAHQNFAQNSRAYVPTNMGLQPQQGLCNQPTAVHRTQQVKTQHDSVSSGVQYQRVQEPFYQHFNGKPSNPSYQIVNTQNHGRNTATQQRILSSVCPSYSEAVSQSFREGSTTSSSNHQILCNSSLTLKNQQYLHQLNSPPYRGGETNSCINLNVYNCHYTSNSVLKETNEQPLKVTAEPPQKQLCTHDEKEIARIVNDLYKSYPDSKGHQQVHTSSTPMGKQFFSEDKLMSNQASRPLTSTTRSSNSDPIAHLESLVTSRKPYTENVVPQKSSPPGVCYVRKTGVKSGNRTKNHSISKGKLFGETGASHLMQLPGSILPQTTETVSARVINQNNIIHPSNDCASMRAVAVVQPLTQESYQFANKHPFKQMDECTATNKSLINPEQNLISPAVAKKALHSNGFSTHLQSPNQKRSDVQHSASSTGGSVASSLDSDLPRPQDMSQKNVARGQCISPVAQMSPTSEVPERQNHKIDKGEMSTDPKACVADISSVHTTPWTADKLAKFIKDLRKEQGQLQDLNFTSATHALKVLFWQENNQSMSKSMSDWFPMTYVKDFCKQHVTSDTVILSQVNENSLKQLKNCHVLKDYEVYFEPPYISSWLNVNEQVDDIDKEFAFSRPLNEHLHTREGDSQSDNVRKAGCEESNKILSQTELVPSDSGEEKRDFTVKTTSSDTTCPGEEGSADSRDPYSFEIKVLPPEEAKSIFEQIHGNIAQGMDTESHPERVTESSMEDRLPKNGEVTGTDLEHRNKEVSSIEKNCCLELLSENSKECNCKKDLNGEDCTENSPDKEEIVVQKDSKLCVVGLDRKLYSDRKGDKQEKSEENVCNQNMTCSGTALSNDHCVDLTGDNEKHHSLLEKSIDNSLSSFTTVSKSGDEELPSSRSEIPSHIPDSGRVILVPEKACVQEPLESADGGLSRNSDCCNQRVKKVFSGDRVSQMSDPCEHVKRTSTYFAKSMSFSLCDETVGKKRKKTSNHKFFFPFPKKSKISGDSEPVFKHVECNKVFTDATDEPSDSDAKNAKLVLFGSKRKLNSNFLGGRKSNVLPPDVLSVNLTPLRRECSSVKQMIHDTWRRSYLPIKKNINWKVKCMTPVTKVVFKKSQRR